MCEAVQGGEAVPWVESLCSKKDVNLELALLRPYSLTIWEPSIKRHFDQVLGGCIFTILYFQGATWRPSSRETWSNSQELNRDQNRVRVSLIRQNVTNTFEYLNTFVTLCSRPSPPSLAHQWSFNSDKLDLIWNLIEAANPILCAMISLQSGGIIHLSSIFTSYEYMDKV